MGEKYDSIDMVMESSMIRRCAFYLWAQADRKCLSSMDEWNTYYSISWRSSNMGYFIPFSLLEGSRGWSEQTTLSAWLPEF